MRASTLCGIPGQRAGRACIVMSAVGRPVPPPGGRRCSYAVLLEVPPRVGAKSRAGSARIGVARARIAAKGPMQLGSQPQRTA
jgi:hypothetical protein